MNFVDYLFENLQDQDKESILSRDGALTYRDLISQVDALAGDLAESLGRGKECLLLSENTPFFIIAYLAIIKSGNTALLVETQIADEQLASIFRECRIGAVFVQKKYRSKIPDAGSVFTKDHLPAPTPAKKYESPAVNDDDVAVVIFTSGSTGAKKGVMLTHRNLCANTESIVQYPRPHEGGPDLRHPPVLLLLRGIPAAYPSPGQREHCPLHQYFSRRGSPGHQHFFLHRFCRSPQYLPDPGQ